MQGICLLRWDDCHLTLDYYVLYDEEYLINELDFLRKLMSFSPDKESSYDELDFNYQQFL